jgi:hypothetical protein
VSHGLHIVVAVDNVALRTAATFAVNNRISGADAKRARANAHALHHLFDSFGYRAHARPAGGYGRHAAKGLQAFGKVARMPINVSIITSEGHDFSM